MSIGRMSLIDTLTGLYRECMDEMRMLYEKKGQVLRGPFQWSSDPDMVFQPYETACIHEKDLNALDQDMDILKELNETTASVREFIQQFDPKLAVKVKTLRCWHRNGYFEAYREFKGPHWLGQRLAERDFERNEQAKAKKAAFNEGYQSMMKQMSYTSLAKTPSESTSLLSRPTSEGVKADGWSRSTLDCLSCFSSMMK